MMNIKKIRLVMATASAVVFLCVGRSMAWFGSGGSPDYSRDAGNMYICTLATTTATQAGISISSPTLSLYNPNGSGKNLVLLDVGINVMSSPAAAAQFSLAYNVTPSSGPNSLASAQYITSALVGKSTGTFTTSVAKCNSLGLLPAPPTSFRMLGGTTGASAIGGVVFTDQTNGKVVVPPGGLISLQASTAANIVAHFEWREDPL